MMGGQTGPKRATRAAHLSSSRVELGDGALRGDQQRADVSPHSHKLGPARSLQLRAPEALQQLQVPHFSFNMCV